MGTRAEQASVSTPICERIFFGRIFSNEQCYLEEETIMENIEDIFETIFTYKNSFSLVLPR